MAKETNMFPVGLSWCAGYGPAECQCSLSLDYGVRCLFDTNACAAYGLFRWSSTSKQQRAKRSGPCFWQLDQLVNQSSIPNVWENKICLEPPARLTTIQLFITTTRKRWPSKWRKSAWLEETHKDAELPGITPWSTMKLEAPRSLTMIADWWLEQWRYRL